MKKVIISILAILAIAFAVYGVISLENKTANQPQRQENNIEGR
jgi:uncharacterized alpha/beta hydrolase family protein